MSLLDLFYPPAIVPAYGRLIVDGKPAPANYKAEPDDIEVDAVRSRKTARATCALSYYWQHRDKELARRRDYRERNKQALKAYQDTYRKKRKAACMAVTE